MPKKTPPLNARGIYQLALPWTIPNDVVYSTKAIRSFKDIYEQGDDVFTLYYQPYGLTLSQFATDVNENANIITLMSDSNDPAQLNGGSAIIYVPDTYITSYPAQNEIPYSHVVLSVSLGAIPDYLALSALKTQLGNTCSNVIGIVPAVQENRAPTSGIVTPTQHADAETARLGLITIRETDYAKAQRLTAEKATLQAQLDTVTKILRDNNLLP